MSSLKIGSGNGPGFKSGPDLSYFSSLVVTSKNRLGSAMTTLVEELIRQGRAPDLTKPRWDQNSFDGRLKHFFTITNPLNLFTSESRLNDCKKIVDQYVKLKYVEPNTTLDELWRAKNLYDSAYHPTTGEKMFVLGRMSSQVPCNMLITGGMLTFYRSTPAVIFWQWINQSYNALVNFANQSGKSQETSQRLWTAYFCATSSAVAAALTLNAATKKLLPLTQRLVPFCAVAVANMINLPIIRSNELLEGIEVFDADGEVLGKSKKVASRAIPEVVISRIFMAVPFMVSAPVLMEQVVKTRFYQKRPWIAAPIQILFSGFMLTFATPIGCAFFPQKSEVSVAKLEPEVQAKIARRENPPTIVYYNKGL
ncbi:unnamed protein product [Bursaphelenchus okinawaensis]|uniref:Sidoreflexin n=1 Tax=Bursaphelenchus okinawaensis TaxID=465554 RepID=A0A811JQU6_9BILA|nr:unnamed protein product [Bursaphelenchus okinawaensis]CAG9079151.1 unnamed protein product [Bursaphelenchus okinawaensis]